MAGPWGGYRGVSTDCILLCMSFEEHEAAAGGMVLAGGEEACQE